jgi:hypothetical protein
LRSVVGSTTMQSAPDAEGDLAHVREIGLLRIAQVLHERAGRRDGGGTVLEPEALKAVGLQLRKERRGARFELERPGVDRRDADGQPQLLDETGNIVKTLGGDDLAGPQHGQLVGQRLTRGGAGVFRRRELAGGEIEERDAVARPGLGASNAHEKRGLARVEVAGVGQRPRRDDANDLAPDKPLGFLGSSTCSQIATRNPFLTRRAMYPSAAW